MPNGNYLWSDPLNWSLDVVPENGEPATFDGNFNSQCIVDMNTTQGLITLQNGYTAPITIKDGITMEISGFEDANIGLDNFVVAFAGADAVQDYRDGEAVMGNFSWEAGGKITVNGGDVTIGNGANLKQSTASPLIINSGVVSIGPNTAADSSTFFLSNGSALINVNPNGQLDFYLPATNLHQVLIQANVEGPEISNNGTTYLVGSSNSGFLGYIKVPFENHAQLNADTGGQWVFSNRDLLGNNLSMDAGQILLMGQASIQCQDQYTQTGGILTVGDDQLETLKASAPGAVNFNGGKIVFDSVAGYGTLAVGNVIFNGVEADMRINGQANSSDLIKCTSGDTCKIQAKSALKVAAENAIQKGLTWTLIASNMGKVVVGDFPLANIQLPDGVGEKVGVPPDTWQCGS